MGPDEADVVMYPLEWFLFPPPFTVDNSRSKCDLVHFGKYHDNVSCLFLYVAVFCPYPCA